MIEMTRTFYYTHYFGNKKYIFVNTNPHESAGVLVRNNLTGRLYKWYVDTKRKLHQRYHATKIKRFKSQHWGMSAPIDEVWRVKQ